MNSVVLIRKHRGKLISAVLLVALAAWFAWAHREDLSRENLVARGQELPAVWFIAAFFILPVIGFPVSILLLLAGVRFGLRDGMALAAAGTIFHHVAAYKLAHGWFRDGVRRRLENAGRKIPPMKEGKAAWVTALFAAIHGPPYAAKLYLLAMTDVPLRIYVGVGAPIYILFNLVPVGAGSAVMDFNPKWLYALTIVSVVFLLGGWWLKRRFGGALANGD